MRFSITTTRHSPSRPDYAETLNNRGVALRDLNRFDEALESYEWALTLRPDYPEALNNRGVALQHLGRLDEALESYERALALRPDYTEALNNRGVTLHDLRRFDEALASYQRALALRPDYPEALNNRGVILDDLKRFEEALESYDRALALRPDYPEALNNRGNTLSDVGRFDEALQNYDRAVALRPDYAEAWNNRSLTLRELTRFEEALESCNRALNITADYAEGQFNKAFLLLLNGSLAEGWAAYESRRQVNGWVARSLSSPEWKKGDPVPRRLLLYSEQGLGDTIQFSRFACTLAARGSEVWLEVQPSLVALLSGLPDVKVIGAGETLPEYDVHLPLMSVPHLLDLTLRDPAQTTPYLSAEADRVQAWARRLPAAQFRVGIIWQGKPTGNVDSGRSIPLRAFAPLCNVPGVLLISLQKYAGAEQLESLLPGMTVETLGEDFDAGDDAFVDCAAVMKNLDLVVSSDTAAAHLAGALGCPVWIVLKYVPDWRWMMHRDDSPWYPTARLFRQTRHGDWDEVFERIARELSRAVMANTKAEEIATQEAGAKPASCLTLPPSTAFNPAAAESSSTKLQKSE